jgi:hypothetical protein
MKRLIITLLFLCCLTAKSQPYIPFPVDSAIWTVDFLTYQFPFGNIVHTPRGYTIAGDSLINGFLYSKIHTSDSAGVTSPVGLVALIREQNKVVYCKYLGTSGPQLPNEVVLYDFNLTTGDTFSYESFFGDTTVLVVDSVGSFQTLTGLRNALYMSIVSNPSAVYIFNPVWVEGIGDIMNGVIYLEVPWVDWWCEGLCFTHPSTLVWSRYGSYCWLNTGIDEIETAGTLKCNPNPAHEQMVISFGNGLHEKNIQLYKVTGEKVFEALSYGKEYVLKKEITGSGIFLLRVIADDNVLQFHKIVFAD